LTVRASGSAPGSLMGLRPPALQHACVFASPSGPPDLRLAHSLGCDLRPSTTLFCSPHRPGLRICAWLTHGAATSGPPARVCVRLTVRASGSAPGSLIGLRPPALHHAFLFASPSGPPDLRLAHSWGCDLRPSS